MNTEARVLATLNKIKEVQSKRKDLGAIEDAFNQQIQIKEELSSKMEYIYLEVESEYANIKDAIQSFISLSQSLKEEWDGYWTEYWDVSNELHKYNEESYDSDVREITDKFRDLNTNIKNLPQ